MHVKLDELAKRPISMLFVVEETEEGAPRLMNYPFQRSVDKWGNIFLNNMTGREGFLNTGWKAELKDPSLFQADTHHMIAPDKVVEVAGYVMSSRGIFATACGYLCDHKLYRQLTPENCKVDMENFTLNYYVNEQTHIEHVGPCIKIVDFTKPVAFVRPHLREQLMDMRSMMGIDISYMADVINPVSYIFRSHDRFSYRPSNNDDQLFNEIFTTKLKVGGVMGGEYFQVSECDFDENEVYVYRKDQEYVWPNFYDPIEPKVRIKKIIGNHYFLSEHGYVCNTDAYEMFDWKKHKGKLLL